MKLTNVSILFLNPTSPGEPGDTTPTRPLPKPGPTDLIPGARIERISQDLVRIYLDNSFTESLSEEVKAKVDGAVEALNAQVAQQAIDEEILAADWNNYSSTYLAYERELYEINNEEKILDVLYWMLDNLPNSAVAGGLTYAGARFAAVNVSPRVQTGYAALATMLMEQSVKLSKKMIEDRRQQINMIHSDLRNKSQYEAAMIDYLKYGTEPPLARPTPICSYTRVCGTSEVIVTDKGGKPTTRASHYCYMVNPVCQKK